MNWKPEIKVFNDNAWYPNGLVFATKQEALDYGVNKVVNWTAAEDFRAVESDLPVNYSYVGGELVPVTAEGASSDAT